MTKSESESIQPLPLSSGPLNFNLTIVAIPFNSDKGNYRIWKLKLESYLTSLNLIDEIKDGKSENQIMREKVKSLILMSLDDATLALIPNLNICSPYEMLKCISETYERKSTSSMNNLRSSLMNMKLQHGEKVSELIKRIKEINEQMKVLNIEPSESDLIYSLFNAIQYSSRYDQIRTALSVSDNLTFNKACQSLLDHQIFIESHSPSLNFKENANSVSSNIICTYCRKPGHTIKKCDRKNKTCFKCHKTGHSAHQCLEAVSESKKSETESDHSMCVYETKKNINSDHTF